MEAFIPTILVVLVIVNVVLIKVDLTFWKDFLTERGKRHKKIKTDR